LTADDYLPRKRRINQTSHQHDFSQKRRGNRVKNFSRLPIEGARKARLALDRISFDLLTNDRGAGRRSFSSGILSIAERSDRYA
jgi:hypothetical protein